MVPSRSLLSRNCVFTCYRRSIYLHCKHSLYPKDQSHITHRPKAENILTYTLIYWNIWDSDFITFFLYKNVCTTFNSSLTYPFCMKPLRLHFPPRICMPLWKLGNGRLFVSPFACLFMYTSSPVCLSGAFVRVFVCVCVWTCYLRTRGWLQATQQPESGVLRPATVWVMVTYDCAGCKPLSQSIHAHTQTHPHWSSLVPLVFWEYVVPLLTVHWLVLQ